MDSKQRGVDEGTRVYEEFEPTFDWVPEEDCDTLLIYLPGFKKEQLRVQLTRTRNLIISGERQTEDNTWTRFRKQFAVSNNCDVNGISARFDSGILYVRQPKLIMSTEKQTEEIAKSTVTKPPKSEPQPQNTTKEQAAIPQAPPRAPTPMKMRTNEKEKKMADEELRSSSKKEEKDEVRNDGIEYKRSEEEKKENYEQNASDKRLSDGSIIDGNESAEKRRADIGYKRAIGDVATNVKRRPKLVMILALVVVMASVVGMYVLKATQFRSMTKENE